MCDAFRKYKCVNNLNLSNVLRFLKITRTGLFRWVSLCFFLSLLMCSLPLNWLNFPFLLSFAVVSHTAGPNKACLTNCVLLCHDCAVFRRVLRCACCCDHLFCMLLFNLFCEIDTLSPWMRGKMDVFE